METGVYDCSGNLLYNDAVPGFDMMIKLQCINNLAQVLHTGQPFDLDINLHGGFRLDLFTLRIKNGDIQRSQAKDRQIDFLALRQLVGQHRPARIVVVFAVF